MKTVTLLYDIAFLTWSEPNPERLGTAEQAIAKMRLWGRNADEAIADAKKIADMKSLEWVSLIAATVVEGIVLEYILNDSMNKNALIAPGVEPKVELVS